MSMHLLLFLFLTLTSQNSHLISSKLEVAFLTKKNITTLLEKNEKPIEILFENQEIRLITNKMNEISYDLSGNYLRSREVYKKTTEIKEYGIFRKIATQTLIYENSPKILYIYTSFDNLKKRSQISLEKYMSVDDIAMSTDGKIYISVFGENGERRENGGQTMYVFKEGTGSLSQKILVIEPKSEKIKDFNIKDSVTSPLGRHYSRQIQVLSNGNIIICSKDRYELKQYDLDGNIVKFFKRNDVIQKPYTEKELESLTNRAFETTNDSPALINSFCLVTDKIIVFRENRPLEHGIRADIFSSKGDFIQEINFTELKDTKEIVFVKSEKNTLYICAKEKDEWFLSSYRIF